MQPISNSARFGANQKMLVVDNAVDCPNDMVREKKLCERREQKEIRKAI